MLYNVQPKGYSCTQDGHTFFVHVNFQITAGFAIPLDQDASKEFQQSMFEQICKLLNSQGSVTDKSQITNQTLSRELGDSAALRAKLLAPKANNQPATIDDSGNTAIDTSPPAKKPRYATVNNGTVNNASHTDDSKLAQSLCLALSQAATEIATTGIPGWWSDLEKLRPNGHSLRDTDLALSVEELDQNCERYSTSLIYRSSMTWLIRCFLEIIRRAFHKRSRANVKKHGEDKVNREQRYRVGELLIAITNPLFARHGKKAYTVYALLAGLETFDPKASCWRRFTKGRMLQLGTQIATILLTPEFEDLWRNIDPALAFDPVEFFTTTNSLAGTETSPNLS